MSAEELVAAAAAVHCGRMVHIHYAPQRKGCLQKRRQEEPGSRDRHQHAPLTQS